MNSIGTVYHRFGARTFAHGASPGTDQEGYSIRGTRHRAGSSRRRAMEVTTLLQTSCILFLLTALGGLAMAGIRFGGSRHPPVWLAMAHGGLAVAGVSLLAWAVLALSAPAAAAWSLLLFLVAAGGGTILFLAYEWER